MGVTVNFRARMQSARSCAVGWRRVRRTDGIEDDEPRIPEPQEWPRNKSALLEGGAAAVSRAGRKRHPRADTIGSGSRTLKK